ncbi:uncharacterized protein LOC128883669 isoform X2 [Hylaeus volcanicus]|uniref:uncharacterized protein LOC128883669 isoform X2 n=1 Tax=Hylaeus volcanicus TaxID=313075 RepID=UPI0023B7C3B8|nr:uncharacterized protein LOC128883669 isoform X2 [Hylaeus volcanicus]
MKQNIPFFFYIAIVIHCFYVNNIFVVATHSKYIKKTPLNKSNASNVLINEKNKSQGIFSDSALEESLVRDYLALKQSELNFKHTHRVAWYSIKGILFWFISIILVLFSGVVSGLTLGFMSVSEDALCKYYKTASLVDKFFIYDILLIKRNHHKLLVTLLLCNSIALEALPIFLDRLMRSWIAVFLSVTVVLIFGEIIPQAVCSSKLRMQILMASIPIVKFLIKIFSLVCDPIAKLLDCFVEPSTEKTTKNYSLSFCEMAILFTEYCRRNAWEDKTFKSTHLQERVITLGFLLQRLTASCCSKTLNSVSTVKTTTNLTSSMRDQITNVNHIIPVYSGSTKSVCGFIPKFITLETIKEVNDMSDIVVYNYTIRPHNSGLHAIFDAFISNELVLLVHSHSDPFQWCRQRNGQESSGNCKEFITRDFLFDFFFNPDYKELPMKEEYSLEKASEGFKEYYFPEPYSFVNVENDMKTEILPRYYCPEHLLSLKKINSFFVQFYQNKKTVVKSNILSVYKIIISIGSLKRLNFWFLKRKPLKEPLIKSVKEEHINTETYDVPPAK